MSSEKRIKAEADYKRGMKYKDIAKKYDVSLNTVKSWKQRYDWSREKGAPSKKSVHTKKRGAPTGNKNAVGNKGGHGGPVNNDKAVKHGFFRRIFPEDEETYSLIDDIEIKNPIDILWENIVIQYTAIARAQKLMYVKDQDDITKVLKKKKTFITDSIESDEIEYELQFAWDKHATFLQAQSRAITTLQGLIKRYEEMLQTGLANEEQELRVKKLKLEIEKIKGENDGKEKDDWVKAIQEVAQKRKVTAND